MGIDRGVLYLTGRRDSEEHDIKGSIWWCNGADQGLMRGACQEKKRGVRRVECFLKDGVLLHKNLHNAYETVAETDGNGGTEG